ncbi:MAG: hypothetical protein K2M19_05090 [Muribaculaceae bacterium]|nr:hypothetical protein [Muribaculaceae bacterium]
MKDSSGALRLLIPAAVCITAICIWLICSTEPQEKAASTKYELAADSVRSICSRASKFIDEAPNSESHADIPGDLYIEAKILIDSARRLCLRNGVPPTLPDSLNRRLLPKLHAVRTSIIARLKVVEGIPAAETPLRTRLTEIDSVISENQNYQSLYR